jgi:hypothetical protein
MAIHMYHHKQRLSFIRMTYSLASTALAVAVWRIVSGARVIPMIGLVVACAVFYAIFLSSLTIEVNGKELRWYRGPGPFWPHRLSLDEIQTVAVGVTVEGMAWASLSAEKSMASGSITFPASTQSSCA